MFTKWMVFFLALCSVVSASWQEEVQQIDKQVEGLQDIQDKYRSRAKKNANDAMRWQFQSENYLDARRAWDRAAADKQKIQEIQDQIDDLNQKKQQILEKHGQKQSS